MNYLTYLESTDFDMKRMREKPEFYFKFTKGLYSQLFVKKNITGYSIYLCGFVPSDKFVQASHYLKNGDTVFVYGLYPTLELCLVQFFEFVQEFATSEGSADMTLYCNQLSVSLSMIRKSWNVSYYSNDFPYMRLSCDHDFKHVATRRVLYKGHDYITAYCHFKPALKEFISYVL